MAKVTFTAIQEVIFDQFAKNTDFSSQFYFTGGTALSALYLNHRYSDDLDFFSENDFDDQKVADFVRNISKKLKAEVLFTRRGKARIFGLRKNDKQIIKIDFVHYPYKRLRKGRTYKGAQIDSLFDIASNKLLTINQRSDIKDFVDLFFLLKKFTVWDLWHSIPVKFTFKYDIVLLAADFLKIEDFDVMPRMIKSLTIDKLKSFFRQKAIELGRKIAE